MPQETDFTSDNCPKNQIWAAYNHMPGGQIMVIHFEDNVRLKKIGDNVQNLLFTAKEQCEAFAKTPKVIALNLRGKIEKNKMLIYQGQDLSFNKQAAQIVIAWAKDQGMQPIESKNDKEPKGFERDKRLEAVEADVRDLKENVLKILEAVGGKK